MKNRFDGKSVIVTGAAQGIGRACALQFGREGARVMIADCAEDPARQVVEEIRQENGQAEACIVDLETSSGAGHLMETTNKTFGGIDVSVHNVGGTIWAKPFWEYAVDEIEREIQRSLWPTLWCCHSVLPYMLDRKAGVIVNIGSIATRGINRVPYAAAKGGVQALTTCISMEVAQYGIRVNCVAPGGTDGGERRVPRNTSALTEIDKAGIKGAVDQTIRDTPMGRFGTTEEQASAVAFLASDEASYITGQTLYVAGGAIG